MNNKRFAYTFGFIVCAGLLAYAYYSQYVLGLLPCPLCILQRAAFFVMGLFFLIGALHNPGRRGYGWYSVPIALTGIAGIAVAGRHVWLQNLPPDQVPSCAPFSLNYMLDTFPLSETVQMIFQGSGSCAEVQWQFMGLTMPVWTLIWYVVLICLAIFAVAASGRRENTAPFNPRDN